MLYALWVWLTIFKAMQWVSKMLSHYLVIMVCICQASIACKHSCWLNVLLLFRWAREIAPVYLLQAALNGTDSTQEICHSIKCISSVDWGNSLPSDLMGTHAVFSGEAVYIFMKILRKWSIKVPSFNWGSNLPSCINGYPVLTGESVYPAVLMGTQC